jgi:N-glycosylase/DNA lyase
MISRLQIHPFSLKDTLECGQFFRFTKVMNTYIVQTSDQIFSLWQKGDFLYYEGVKESFLTHLFRLEEDLDLILKEIDRDQFIHLAVQKYRGMRLIRQDPWECLFSFLCSSAKTIPHIRTMIEALCKSAGERVLWGNHVGYGFPEAHCIKSCIQLESVKAGFRTNYLVKVSRCIDRNQLYALKGLPYREARQKLMSLPGVGRKIADCTLLYSLDFLEAFPVDTWIKKGLQKVYFGGRRIGEKEMEEFTASHFGLYAGYAQLYLYHFWRHHTF